MNALPVHTTGRTRQLLGVAGNLEIDPPLGGVELDLAHPMAMGHKGQLRRGR
jgi:hypothetical protein